MLAYKNISSTSNDKEKTFKYLLILLKLLQYNKKKKKKKINAILQINNVG